MKSVKGLNVGNGLVLPLDAVTESIAILAVRRAGKSNAAVVMAEEMHRNNLHWIAIDPKSDWFGIRSSKDGKGPGLPIAIFGGQHGDVPLEPNSGQMIADLIIDQRISCVLDVSGFESEAAKIRFLLAFGDRLFRRKDRSQEPTHVFFEEVDDYCPQKPFHEQARLVHVMARILKQGGSRGLGGTIISQRSAVVNKDLLTQAQTLFALRTTSPQDRKAIKDWVSFFGENPNIIESLPSLGDGEAWVWSPNWLKQTKKFKFHRRSTFDSGSTPKVGGSRQAPATLADIDIDAIRGKMKETVARAEANDPTKLKTRIAELERQLSAKVKSQPVQQVVKCDHEKQIRLLIADAAGWKKLAEQTGEALLVQIAAVTSVQQTIEQAYKERSAIIKLTDRFRAMTASPLLSVDPSGQVTRLPDKPSDRPNVPRSPRPPAGGGDRSGEACQGMNSTQFRLLSVLAKIKSIGIDRAPRTMLAAWSDLRVTGTFKTYLSDMKTRGLIDKSGEEVWLTEEGESVADRPEIQPTLEDLHASFLGLVNTTQQRMLRNVIDAYPRSLTREELASSIGLKVTGTFKTYLSEMKTIGAIVYSNRDSVRASDLLFPEGLK